MGFFSFLKRLFFTNITTSFVHVFDYNQKYLYANQTKTSWIINDKNDKILSISEKNVKTWFNVAILGTNKHYKYGNTTFYKIINHDRYNEEFDTITIIESIVTLKKINKEMIMYSNSLELNPI